jgi:hypothetical protein
MCVWHLYMECLRSTGDAHQHVQADLHMLVPACTHANCVFRAEVTGPAACCLCVHCHARAQAAALRLWWLCLLRSVTQVVFEVNEPAPVLKLPDVNRLPQRVNFTLQTGCLSKSRLQPPVRAFCCCQRSAAADAAGASQRADLGLLAAAGRAAGPGSATQVAGWAAGRAVAALAGLDAVQGDAVCSAHMCRQSAAGGTNRHSRYIRRQQQRHQIAWQLHASNAAVDDRPTLPLLVRRSNSPHWEGCCCSVLMHWWVWRPANKGSSGRTPAWHCCTAPGAVRRASSRVLASAAMAMLVGRVLVLALLPAWILD